MIDGFVLLDEVNAAPQLIQTIYQMPPITRDIIFSIVMGLFTRQNKAIESVESYSYESFSRVKWKSLGGNPQGLSGIPGRLGSNHVQQMWTFYNEVEDRRVYAEALWEGFKLSVSPHAPKGIKKIDTRDKQTKNNEFSRRQAVHDRFFYTRIGLLSKPKVVGEQSVPGLGGSIIPKTDEDLADEMYRWVKGEDDEHDRIVREYKAQITTRYEYEKQEREAQREAIRQQQESIEADVGPRRLVAYTTEQLAEMLKGRNAGRPAGARTIQTEPDSRDRLYSRYLERAPDPGLLKPVDGHLVPVQGAMGSSLDEKLGSRRVTFGVADGQD